MIVRTLVSALLFAALGWGTPDAKAADEVGVEVTVQVVDPAGVPVSTAVVRHPKEADRHRVNTETGRWVGQVLYMPDGGELVFQKGMELEFEVSAPGYQNMRVLYEVKKRKNLVEVVLQKMDVDQLMEDEDDDPVIQFGRDRPID
jgi:hypothetical protein